MANKMTYAVAIDNAINGNINDEVIERLTALKEQLAKRNGSGKKGLTKAQKENVDFKAHIAEMLEVEVDGMTATEVGAGLHLTCQRASALLNQMIDEGRAHKVKEGRVTRFYAGPAEDGEIADGE